MTWDYIIVGSGSAGAVLANRLSANPAYKVLLLEAGGSDRHIRYKLPALCVDCMGHEEADWSFKSEPDPTRAGRQDVLSRGRVLGGSSSINGAIYVRGNRGDYDGWAQMGNRGWDYDTMLGYFKKLEDNRDGSSDAYGKGGPIVVSQLTGVPKMTEVFVEAMAELGYRKNPSYNGEPGDGVSIGHTTSHKGLRWSAARGYLHPIKHRKNLTIETGAEATRILMEGRRAVGVEYRHKGAIRSAKASREVILSASVFNSPKLLMLSGIGDAEELRALGIEVVHHLPGVGRNLHDHPASYVKAVVTERTTNLELSLWHKFRHGLKFLTTRGGPATYVQTGLAFVKSRPDLEYPDIQFHFGAYGYKLTNDGFEMLEVPSVTLQPNVNRTRSRGYMKLRSKDPFEKPLIQMNMLSDPYDVETLIAGTRIARKALATKAFAPYLVSELAPGPEIKTDAQWEEYTRSVAGHVYHACGTCKMGVDDMAVVDPELRVHGIEGLRVVDSSIIPQIPSANLNAISMAIGEKGADLILSAK